MSKLICGSAIAGAHSWVRRADATLTAAIRERGEDCPVAFPDTTYFLPVTYSFTGDAVRTLADLRGVLRTAQHLVPPVPSDAVWLPYLGQTLDAGAATLFCMEVIEACNYLLGPDPVHGIWLGSAADVILRKRGIEFVDGTAPGFAAVTGCAPTSAIAVRIARELQQKNLYVFMAGATGGKQFADQLAEEGVQLGWETRLVPFGSDVSSIIFSLGFASRVALSFGGIKPGDFKGNLTYNKNRIFAFVLALGEIDAEKYAVAAGALNYGFPVIADTDIPEILPTGICTYEHVVSRVPHESMVDRALEVRGCKVGITKVPIPVAFGPAFEGERIRKQDTHVEFGGNITPAFEFVRTVALDEIDDGTIEIVGPDIDDLPPSGALPLGIWVEVAGRKMQADFESILERQIHHLLNGAEGVWHMGQRDIVWTRISQAAFKRGFRLKHYGEILHAKFLADYPAIVDKVKVTLITDRAEVNRRVSFAREIYVERNRRVESMTDESVETFYSCLLCQSFAPNHVCIITPERLGLCGAYNWLDGKAAHEIDETGPNQPVRKGECLDPVAGVWEGVNEYIFQHSHKTITSFSAYSIMSDPMTSCGCFEVICAYVPECNGIMAVNREYMGETPIGMNFSTLAGNIGGGQQTPGFVGCGKAFLTSKKFLSAEGGLRRLVWMPKDLKAQLGEGLAQRGAEQGVPDIMERIADESTAIDAAALSAFMQRVNHPALAMLDLNEVAVATPEPAPVSKSREPTPVPVAAPIPAGGETFAAAPLGPVSAAEPGDMSLSTQQIESLKAELLGELKADLKHALAREVVTEIIEVLTDRFLGPAAKARPEAVASSPANGEAAVDEDHSVLEEPPRPAAMPSKRSNEVKCRLTALAELPFAKEKAQQMVHVVTLGATKADGGTRKHARMVGGATAMPFHGWEGEMPHRPLVALEVFDRVSEKYPAVLRDVYGDLLHHPAEMARACVERFGADLISVRLDGTHPERGNYTAERACDTVKSVLEAVDVPLIVTGHNHFQKMNDVTKEVARAAAGERLLFNWVEPDNYRTVAGAALAYGHSLVALGPIDVNITKQLSILLTNMGLPASQIVIDPMTGAMGYGLEYTYSVMERIRQTGLGGDVMLASPMIVSPGCECAKIKEFRASEVEMPAWGELKRRAPIWELTTATSLLHAGADVLIMYHPDAALALKQTIFELWPGEED